MCPHQQVIDELRTPTRDLRRMIPDVWDGFQSLHRAAMADGDVPARLKEGVALAISVVKRCDGCIAYHAKAAARVGATEDEVAELLGVAVLMELAFLDGRAAFPGVPLTTLHRVTPS